MNDLTLTRFIDLRSDTVTRPTPAMRAAMMAAQVGDDVYGEDPTVNALEATAARISGKDAAIFVTTGTMANELAIRLHTQPGDEVLMHELGHPFHHESGGPAALSGVTIRPLPGDRGLIPPDALRRILRPDIRHMSAQTLLCIENTHNHGGGTVYPLPLTTELSGIAHGAGLAVHMDGARVFNASVASGVGVAEIAAPVDTLSFCLSKGLGAPVGSLLCGPKPLIDRARRFRHMLGGGWRQAGFLAAAGLYALEHHVARLADDHRRARRLAEAIGRTGRVRILAPVETNIVLFAPLDESPDDFAARLASRGVRVSRVGPDALRAVLHLDVSDDDLDIAIRAFGG